MDEFQLRNVWRNRHRPERISPLSQPLERLVKHTLARRVRQLGRLAVVWDECIPAFLADVGGGSDTGIGSDLNCDGFPTFADIPLFLGNVSASGPGPSGLYCQGNPPLASHTPCTF